MYKSLEKKYKFNKFIEKNIHLLETDLKNAHCLLKAKDTLNREKERRLKNAEDLNEQFEQKINDLDRIIQNLISNSEKEQLKTAKYENDVELLSL